MNLWIKRAIGAAALGGGLLALSAGAAGAQEVSADVSARLGRQTSAEVRVCADGRVLSRLLGSCGQAASGGTRVTVDAGRDRDGTGVRARARVPRLAAADVSVGTRRSRPAGSSGQASTPRAQADATAAAGTSPGASADATARLSRLRDGRLLDLDGELSLAGVGLLGSSLFTLAGDPASDSLLPTGELTLGDLTGEAPAGIGVLETGPIASGNQVGVAVGDVSPSVPVTVCGNGVGVLSDTSAACAPAQGSTGGGSTGTGSSGATTGTGDASGGSLLDGLASGNQVDAGIGDISPSVPVTVCGNGVGVLGDASAACGTGQPVGGGSANGPADGSANGSAGGSAGTDGAATGILLDDLASGNQVDGGIASVSPSVPVTVCGNAVGALGDASAACGTGQQTGSGGTTPPSGDGGSTPAGGSGNEAEVSVDGVSPTVPVSACGNSVGLLGDASASCGADTSSGGIIAPPPDTTPGQTGTDGIPGTDTGTSGIPGTPGTTGTSGLIPGDGGAVTTFAPLRPSAAGSGALPFTGAGSDLLALFAAGLLAAGALVVRATRPAAAREGGEDR